MFLKKKAIDIDMDNEEDACDQHFLLFQECFLSLLSHILTLSQKQTLLFTCLQYKSFENIVGKGEIARNELIFLFPSVFFYPFG